MKASLNKIDYLHVVILVLINVLLTDLLSSNILKKIISVLPFFVLIFLYFFKSKAVFYKVFITYLFAFPFSPRDIVLVQQGESLNSFISFINFNVGFLSLSLFSIIFFTILEVLKIGLLTKFINYFIVFIMSFVVYSIVINSGDFYFSFFITDLKPFLIFFFGYFFGLCTWLRFKNKWSELFLKILYILLFIYTLKTIFYLSYDFVIKVYNTSFSTLPYLFIPVLFLAFFTKDLKRRNLIMVAALISSFSVSRGYFIMIGVLYLFLPFFFINIKNLKKVLASYFIFTCLGFLTISFSHLFLSEKINIFLQYKLDFFSEELFADKVELNRSTLIRVYEFKNIIFELLSNPFFLIFGKGLGGYFEFKQFVLPTYIDVDAFSFDQIKLNKYFRPHTFFNVALLKGGVLLLIIYSKKCIDVFLYSKKLYQIKRNEVFITFAGIFSLLFFFFFWIPEFLFLDGLILGYVKSHKRSNFF